jgi:hypothetical protein
MFHERTFPLPPSEAKEICAETCNRTIMAVAATRAGMKDAAVYEPPARPDGVGVITALRASPSRTNPSLRGPQARGNPGGLSAFFGVSENRTAVWIAASLRSSH